jgi:hypothetical protein
MKITEWVKCLVFLSVETHVYVNVPFVMFLSVTIIPEELPLPCSETLQLTVLVTHVKFLWNL